MKIEIKILPMIYPNKDIALKSSPRHGTSIIYNQLTINSKVLQWESRISYLRKWKLFNSITQILYNILGKIDTNSQLYKLCYLNSPKEGLAWNSSKFEGMSSKTVLHDLYPIKQIKKR